MQDTPGVGAVRPAQVTGEQEKRQPEADFEWPVRQDFGVA